MTTKFLDFNKPQNKLNDCDIIMLDTCVMINLASKDNAALEFARYTLQNNIMLCYSSKSIEEIYIRSQSRNIPRNKRQAIPKIDMYINNSFNDANSIINAVNILPNMFKEPIGVVSPDNIKKIKNNSIQHTLGWGDATIYTLAKENDIKYIWTVDRDWSRLKDSDMTIITESKFIPKNQSNNIVNVQNGIIA